MECQNNLKNLIWNNSDPGKYWNQKIKTVGDMSIVKFNILFECFLLINVEDLTFHNNFGLSKYCGRKSHEFISTRYIYMLCLLSKYHILVFTATPKLHWIVLSFRISAHTFSYSSTCMLLKDVIASRGNSNIFSMEKNWKLMTMPSNHMLFFRCRIDA